MALFGEELITRTKFIAPTPKRSHLVRPRLHALLDGISDVPVAVVVGGTGYGKSSLIAGYLQATGTPALWYELAERDADPQLFALHLAHLCHRAFPGAADRALSLLAQPGGASRTGRAAIEALADALLDRLERDTWLVLDDFHLLADTPEALALVNTLAGARVPRLHVVLASRQRPDLPDLPRWRLQGDVVTLEQEALAFTPEEIGTLFEQLVGDKLDDAERARLMAETEGWPMALQLVAQRRREHAGPVAGPSGSLRDLFDYLAREVLAKLEPDEREFLLATAPLTRLDGPRCQALAPDQDAPTLLRALNERGLFLIPLDAGSYRHHHLFREFLLERLKDDQRLASAHLAAATALWGLGEHEEAVEQWLAAGSWEAAAEGMVALAPALVNSGRYTRLGSWLAKLPEDLLSRAPALAVYQGDACRLTSRFDEAIAWYDRALTGYAESPEGQSRALAGKALVYLDTVQPAQAEHLLERALALPVAARRRAELLVMLAENKMNRGDSAAAESLFAQARAELPEIAENEARICLRTGRLAEARAILRQAIAHAEPQSAEAATKSHREATLVASLVESMLGEPAAAEALARAGLERARRQQASWTEAVALIRLGHAALVGGETRLAEGHYRQAIALAAALAVPRLKAEALMGLALVAGRSGDTAAAETFVKEGVEIAQEASDAWMSALLSVSLGAVYAGLGDPKAERWLVQAQNAYERCGDPCGQAIVALWSARLAMALGETKAVAARVRALADAARRYDYGFLLTRATLLGFPDAEAARAFATSALEAGVPRAMLAPWLGPLGLTEADEIRDDALRVRALGAFRVWRGGEELGARAWGREKARQLFHLLLAHRGQFLPKTRIIDTLWPDLDLNTADGTFRVALNALNKALEPERKGKQEPRFVLRQGTSYGLAGGTDVWLDVAEFERLLDAAGAIEASGEDPTELYRQALELYEGDFLAEYPQYEAWCERERERLRDRFVDGGLRLARRLSARGDDTACAHWANRVLERHAVAEEAYRLLMVALYRQGDRAGAIRTYDRCVVALDDELDVDPMPETQALYEKIQNLEPVA